MLDVTRVTVLGGSKRKVATKDRRGAVAERYDVRWRVQLTSGETRMFRQRFDRSIDARWPRLQAVGLPASGWHLDDGAAPATNSRLRARLAAAWQLCVRHDHSRL